MSSHAGENGDRHGRADREAEKPELLLKQGWRKGRAPFRLGYSRCPLGTDLEALSLKRQGT